MTGTCTWPGCDAPHLARGLCEKAYRRVHDRGWVDHDTPGPTPARKVNICGWPGCGAPRRSGGLCKKGYGRVHHRGWVDHDTPPPRPTRSPKICTWAGCGEPAATTGLCSKGYQRIHKLGWIDHDTPARAPRVDTCTWPNCDAPILARGVCSKGWQRLQTLGWIDHDTPCEGARVRSNTVYVARHREMNAVKIGIGGPRRQQHHAGRGWDITGTWHFVTADEAFAAERRVLDLWTGIRPFLTAEQMPQHGHTETIDADAYDEVAVAAAVAGRVLVAA